MAHRRLPRRLTQLYIGLLLYGLAGALQVRSGLGLDPWDVLHQGVSRHTGIAIGTIVIIVGAAVLLLWIPLRQRPGFGTISNVVVIGLSMNGSLDLLPHSAPLGVRIAEMLGGIVLCGTATGMYIGANMGPGPRDGLMTGLARRTGRSIRLVRTGIEVTVLAVGWTLGGTVGIGTVLFALVIGPLAQIFLPLFRLPDTSLLSSRAGDQRAPAVAGRSSDIPRPAN
ncbi:MAG: YczE/YyaS/YitT family protein [Jatrophihabitans sp.]